MKKTFPFFRPARAAACFAALALLLPAAVFAASHENHDGWSMLLSTDSTLNDAKYYMAKDLTIDRTVRFQHDGPQTFCLAGRTLTVNLTGSGGRFVVTTSLTVESCVGEGGINVKNGPVSVYGPLTLTSGVTVGGDIYVTTYQGGTVTQIGSLTVESGSTVNGTITVGSGTTADISGTVNGPVTVKSGAAASISGTVTGKITVESGASLTTNGADLSGGVDTSGTASLTGTTVSRDGVTVKDGTCTITGGTISNILKTGSGGGVYVGGGECIIQGDTQITGNKATSGGGVYVAGGKCTIDGSAQVGENTAGGSGGGVYVQAGSTCWIREYSIIFKNHAGGNGGGVCVEEGSSFVVNSTVQENTASGSGGGVYLAGPAAGAGSYNMDNAIIYNNKTESGDGGGIYAGENVKIVMAAGSIDSNTARGDGGGVYLAGGCELSTTTKIRNNTAETGGGVWATSNCTILLNGNEASTGLISANTAESGSGMYVNGAGWTVEFNGALVYEKNDLYFAGSSSSSADDSVLRIGERGAAESTIRGNIQAENVTVTMNKGTIQSDSVKLENTTWLMYGGYCSISGFETDGGEKVWLYGGYFNAPPADTDHILVGSTGDPCVMFPISGDDSDPYFDPAWKEGYSYGVYAVENDAASLNQTTIIYDGHPVEPGADFTLEPAGTVLLEYSCTDAAGNSVAGWPKDAGSYTIRAKCLNTAGKWYAETSFALTISKADPDDYTVPTGLSGLHGHDLADVALPAGWAWEDGTTTLDTVGEQDFTATFTPADTANCNTVDVPLTVTVAHDWGGWTSGGDGTHTGSCRCAGCGETVAESCSGGSATYFLQAVCQVCGGAYGPLKADTTPPAGEIVLGENRWNQFLHSITFGLFFKETQQVTVTASDDSCTVGGYTPDKAPRVEYYLHSGGTALTLEDLKGVGFTRYDRPFSIDPEAQLVVYVKITDHAGNAVFISSDGIVLDATAPALTGVEDGAVCYVTQGVSAADAHLSRVTVQVKDASGETGSGQPVTGGTAAFTLAGDVAAEYTVTAADSAGNTATLTVTMKPLSELEKPMAGLTTDNVASGDRARLEALRETLRAIDLTAATQAEKDKVAELLARCQALLARLDALEWTPLPTATPAPAAAPAPTPKPAATARPVPSPTAAPEPSATPAPAAQASPAPTAAPDPTEPPASTQGQQPSGGFPWALALTGLALAAVIGLMVTLLLRKKSGRDDQP